MINEVEVYACACAISIEWIRLPSTVTQIKKHLTCLAGYRKMTKYRKIVHVKNYQHRKLSHSNGLKI